MPDTSIEKEKDRDVTHYEHAYPDDHITSSPEAEEYPSGPALAPGEKEDKATRRLICKIDIRLLPVLAVIYAFALIKTRIDRDRGDAVVDTLNLTEILHHLRNWKLWEWA